MSSQNIQKILQPTAKTAYFNICEYYSYFSLHPFVFGSW